MYERSNALTTVKSTARLLLSFLLIALLSSAKASGDNNNVYWDNIASSNKECQAYIKDIKHDIKKMASSHLSRTFLWENDSFAKGGDRHYTNGMKLSWTYNPCRNKSPSIKKYSRIGVAKLYSIIRHPFSEEKDNELERTIKDNWYSYTGGIFGMNMYTPNDLRRISRNIFDRPYAGWLYGGFLSVVSDIDLTDPKKADENHIEGITELAIGAIGPISGQEEAQKWIHRHVTKSTFPMGWDNQVSNRVGVNLLHRLRYRYKILNDVSAYPEISLSVGNVVNFAGIGGRIQYSTVPQYPGETITPAGSNLSITSEENTEQSEQSYLFDKIYSYLPTITVFLGFDARYVDRSIFIQGKDESAHQIDLKHDVYDILLGGSLQEGDISIGYTVIWRSKEFNSPKESLVHSHRIGQINLSCFW